MKGDKLVCALTPLPDCPWGALKIICITFGLPDLVEMVSNGESSSLPLKAFIW